MTGFATFFRKELQETLRTWRIWVIPAVLVFSAVSSPVLTALLPSLVDRFGGAASGLTIEVGEQTALDAYVEYLGNLGELATLVVVIAAGGIVSGELRHGPATLMLTKPLSRAAYVIAKWSSQALLLALAAVASTALAIILTTLLFELGPVKQLAGGVSLWLVYAVFLLTVMAALSSLLAVPVAASGAGVAVYAALAGLSQLGWVAQYTPAGLPVLAGDTLYGRATEPLWPLVTAIALGVVLLTGAVLRFSRREL
jgi:ABC-2 type transport system permease protein